MNKLLILRIVIVICILIGILCTVVFANRIRLPYNNEGKFFDASKGIVYHKQAVLVYGLFMVLAFSAGVILFYFEKKIRDDKEKLRNDVHLSLNNH